MFALSRVRVASCLVVGFLAVACGDDDQPAGPGGGGQGNGGAGATGGSGASGGVGATGGLGGAGGDLGGTAGCSSDCGGEGGEGGGTGALCGGRLGRTCGATEYCDFPDDQCGAADGTGVCTPRPTTCPDQDDPTCACNGTVYGNECEAHMAGSDTSNLGGCAAEAGEFACGAKFCATAAQYCQHTASDVGGLPDSYSCLDLPAACQVVAVPSCTCAMAATNACGGTCEMSDGGVLVHCPGG